MKADRVAVVGASARAAAFSLLRAGHQVVAADLFADADLRQHCQVTLVANYPDDFEAWLAATSCDAWIYTGALENDPVLVDRLAQLRPLLGHGRDDLRNVRDPLQLQTKLNNADIPFPTTVLRDSGTPGAEDDCWIGKTYRGSSGSGVGVADAAFRQRRIEGIPLSALYRGERLLGVTRQLVGEPWTGAAEFQYCGSIGPWQIPDACNKQLLRLGEVLCHEFDLQHLYGVDLIFDGKQVWVIEVNPRYTAAVEVVERGYGISVFAESGLPIQSSTYIGKVILFAAQQLTISENLSNVLLAQAGDLPWPRIADIPMPGTEIAGGQPVLTLFTVGNTPDEVERHLRQNILELEAQLY